MSNRRTLFVTPAKSNTGLTCGGNATWTGMLLSVLLAQAGVRVNALEVIFEGAD
ncbi:MAG: hypothetical protein EOO60_06985 [Hymenobacter sp.]|nr:MAG: hypothetical protein EOO60_06985 [Hymenobacter sp.]